MPYLALNDDYSRHYGYDRFPFANDDGLSLDAGRAWMGHVAYTQQYVPGSIAGYRGEASATFAQRLSVETAYTQYAERLNNRKDYLALAEVIPTFTFAESPHWTFRAGLGYQRIDGPDIQHRLKVVYRVSSFYQPFHFDLDLGVSNLSGYPLWEIAPGISYHWNRFQFKAGYRRLTVSDQTIDGPELSIGVWF